MNPNESNLPVPTEDGAVERASQTPLGTEFATAEEELSLDPLAGAGVGKRVNGGFILIVAVVLSAVAGLFSMRKLAQFSAVGIGDTKVEATIETFLNNIGANGTDPTAPRDPARVAHEQRVLAVLTEPYSDRQVPFEDVSRDPFVLETESTTSAEPINNVEPEDEAERLERERQELRDETRERMVAAGETMSLKSILGGSTMIAIIGESIVRTGETVTVSSPAGDITFRVAEITTSSVDLVAENPDLDLTVTVTVYLDR